MRKRTKQSLPDTGKKSIQTLQNWLIDSEIITNDDTIRHPLIVLIELANDERYDPNTRMKAANYALPYLVSPVSTALKNPENAGKGMNVQVNMNIVSDKNIEAKLLSEEIPEEPESTGILPNFPNAKIAR